MREGRREEGGRWEGGREEMMADTRAHTSDNTYTHSPVLYSSISMGMLTCRNDITYVWYICAVHYTVGVLTSTVLLYCSITPCTVHLLSHACMRHTTGMIKQYSLALSLLSSPPLLPSPSLPPLPHASPPPPFLLSLTPPLPLPPPSPSLLLYPSLLPSPSLFPLPLHPAQDMCQGLQPINP